MVLQAKKVKKLKLNYNSIEGGFLTTHETNCLDSNMFFCEIYLKICLWKQCQQIRYGYRYGFFVATFRKVVLKIEQVYTYRIALK